MQFKQLQQVPTIIVVALSLLIAILASYAALDLGGRVTVSRGYLRSIWLMGGAYAMGMGIWSMHYLGMLAYSLPARVFHHWPAVLLSLLAAYSPRRLRCSS
jgi:NO-binding membrane sensor protein with MHYT domain